MIAAYIGLGSNLQNPYQQLKSAVIAVDGIPRSQVAGVSGVYRSAAVGPGEQPHYLNAVLRLDTVMAPESLLVELQRIERAQGRVRTQRWGARTLDLDMLLYGDAVLTSPQLTVPHPAMMQRNFVLYPLAELAGPNLVLPDGVDLATLLDRCPRGDLEKTTLTLTPSVRLA